MSGARFGSRRFLLFVTFLIARGSPTAPDLPTGAIRVSGTVFFHTIEGGFWAIRGNDGVIAQVRNDRGGIHMVGPIVEILSIEPQ